MSARGIDRKELSWREKLAKLRTGIAQGITYSSARERITNNDVRLLGEALMQSNYLDTDWCDEDGPFERVVLAYLCIMRDQWEREKVR